MQKHCEHCKKPIGEKGKIYMAGSICKGHIMTPIQYTIYKIKRFIFGKDNVILK